MQRFVVLLPLLAVAALAMAIVNMRGPAPAALDEEVLPDQSRINYAGTRLEWPNPDFEPVGGYPRSTFEARSRRSFPRMTALSDEEVLPDQSRINYAGTRLEWPNPDFEPVGGYPRSTFEARTRRGVV
jgi:hypothetical protein